MRCRNPLLNRCRPKRDRGKLGERPCTFKDDDIAAAKAILKDSDIPVSVVTRRIKVSPATLCKRFPGSRSGTQGGETYG